MNSLFVISARLPNSPSNDCGPSHLIIWKIIKFIKLIDSYYPIVELGPLHL
jgi:hypothetical protein